MMNERIRQVLADAALKGMSEMDLYQLREKLEVQILAAELRRLAPDMRVLEAAERVNRVCGPRPDVCASGASAPAVAAPEPVAAPAEAVPVDREDDAVTAINSLPKSQWKVQRSNRWTTAALEQMRAMRATYSDRQIAEAFGLRCARQVGNLIGSRLANRSR